MQEHADAQSKTREEATSTIGELEHYKQVIEDAAGQGANYKGSQEELQTAIDKVNDALDTNFDKADVLTDTYRNQKGAVKDLTSELDNLVAAKEREIRLDAVKNMYQEQVQAEVDARMAYDQAKKDYDDFIQSKIGTTATSDKRTEGEQAITKVLETEADVLGFCASEAEGYLSKVENTKTAWQEAKGGLDSYSDALHGLEDESAYLKGNMDAFGKREGTIMMDQDMTQAIKDYTNWGDTLEQIQPHVHDLAQGLEDAKIGVQDVIKLSESSPSVFEGMVQRSESDIGKLVDEVNEWNLLQLQSK